MKKVIIGIAMAVCLTMGFTIYGSGKDSSSGLVQNMMVEKAFASESELNIMALDNQAAQDNHVFSWPTILSLYAGMIIIVSIRRNTYV